MTGFGRAAQYPPFVRRAWAVFRRAQQEHRIRFEQREYERAAARQDLPPHDPETVKETVRNQYIARLRAVGHSLSGRLRILYCGGFDIWERHNLLPALQEAGDLVFFDQFERGFRPHTSHWMSDRRRLNADLLRAASDEAAKGGPLLFLASANGNTFLEGTVTQIGQIGFLTCGYFMDDRLIFRGRKVEGRWSGPASVAAEFDVCLTNATASIVKYRVEGGQALFWPAGANPHVFRPLGIQRDVDVAFVGAAYGPRTDWVNWLRRKGLDVRAVGPGWPSGSVSTEAMIELFSRARVVLGMSGIGYSMNEFCLKGRDFEAPMAGVAYVTPRQPDLPRVFDVGREVVAYGDRQECLDVIRGLLADPTSSAGLRERARARSLRDHTWRTRIAELKSILPVEEHGMRGGHGG